MTFNYWDTLAAQTGLPRAEAKQSAYEVACGLCKDPVRKKLIKDAERIVRRGELLAKLVTATEKGN